VSAFAIIAGAALLADYHGTLTVADTTLVQVRGVSGDTMGEPQIVVGPTADVITKPNVAIEITSGHWDYAISYFPVFTLQDVEDGFDFIQDHLGSLGLFWHDRRTNIGVLEEGGYGQINFTTIPPTGQPNAPPPPLQLLPPGQILNTAYSKTRLRSIVLASRRLTVTTAIGYQGGGGIDDASRATLPFEKGPLIEGLVDYRVTRLDRLVTTVNGIEQDFTEVICPTPTGGAPPTRASCTPQSDLMTATEEWRRRLSPGAEVYANAGGAAVRTRQQTSASYDYALYAVGGAGVTTRVAGDGSATTFRLTTLLAPIVTQQTGIVEERVNADGSIEWTRHRVTLSALGRVAQTIPDTDPGAALYLRAELDATYAASRRLKVTLGARTDWTRIEVAVPGVPAGTETLSTLGFVQAALTEPPIRF
jgi:hypothetical protein